MRRKAADRSESTRLGVAAPMNGRACLLALLSLCAPVSPLSAQGVVVDQGRFAVTLDARQAGTEEFSVRRAGFGRDDAFYANSVIRLSREGGAQEVRTLLRASPPDGATEEYQATVTGLEAMELGLTRDRIGGRYRALVRSGLGEENREFPARPDTKTLDLDVAHQYYFLRELREGSTVHVLVPRDRRQTSMRVGPWSEDEIQLGPNRVVARRVELSSGEDRHVVWFDRLGRVVRVEVPGRGYVAERTDLVG